MSKNTNKTATEINQEANKEFEKIVRPVIKFMNKLHPHHVLIIDCTRAELFEGQRVLTTNDYIKD